MKSSKRSSRGLHLVPRSPATLPKPAVLPEPAVLPKPGWETAAHGWSAGLLLMCICGWTADLNDSQVASCSNPACSCRARAYNVRLTITEIDCKGTI